MIEKLEKLSMLRLDEQEKEIIEKDLNEIIGFVENLNEIDVSEIDASFSTINSSTKLRDDKVILNEDIVKGIKNNAPKLEDNFFIVPQIIE